jgi:hypothetical protein
MVNREDERDIAERMDAYIDEPQRDPNVVSREVARVVDTLQQAAADVTPRPGFLNELAQELRAREKTIMQQDKPRPLLFRVLAGGLTAVAAIALVVVVAGLFARRADEPALADLDMTPPSQPALIANAETGFLAGTQIQVMDAPSGERQQLPGYTYQQPPVPQTAAEMREIAARFGLDDVRIYQQHGSGSLTAIAADGRTLTMGDPAFNRGGYYYSDPTVALDTGEALPFASAAAAAEAFLQASGMAPEAYELQPGLTGGQAGLTPIRVVPLLEGRPVTGGNETMVTVNGAGEVVSANIVPFAAMPTGELIDAGSAREALQQLLTGAGNYSYNWNTVDAPGENPARVFSPSGAGGSPGETVTIDGWATVYTDIETGETLVQLYSGRGSLYYVDGLELGEMERNSAMAGSGISVTGLLEEQLGERAWRLQAQSWEATSQQPECRVGTVERAEAGFYFYPDGDEQRYLLGEAPEDLHGGLRVELCAGQFDPAVPLDWLHMAAPPMAEVRSSGGGSGGSAVAVEVVEVEVTPLPVAPTPVPLGEAGGVVEERTVVVPPPPAALPADSPYKPGDEVDLTGRVTGMIRLDGDERVYEIALLVDTDGDPTTFPTSFGLQGEPELLEALSEHYYLQVAVSGTIVEGQQWGQAIAVDSFERVSPEEKLEAFLGMMTVETIEGRDVTVFVDEATGQRYAVNPAAGSFGAGEEGARVWIAAVVHGGETFGGLPIIEILSQSQGSQIDALQTAAELPVDRAMPVYDPRLSGPRGDLGDSLIVDRIVLGYRLETIPLGAASGNRPPTEFTFTLQPAWLFEGRTADGQSRFAIQLPVGNDPPDVVPAPTPTPLPGTPPTGSTGGSGYPAPGTNSQTDGDPGP